jgi:AraC-like DNA-binding protein
VDGGVAGRRHRCLAGGAGPRFTDLVGEPPMRFLTGWRLAMAADLLREPDATLGSVARRVGYGSPFALSAAFQARAGREPAGAPDGRHRRPGG